MDNNPAGAPGTPGTNGVPVAGGSPTPTGFGNPNTVNPGQMTSIQVNSLDPNGRPMEQVVPPTEPVKKKKTGLIIGIIIGILCLVGIIVAVVAILLSNQKDTAVTKAIQKIMDGNTPANMHLGGDVDITINTPGTPVKGFKVSLDSNLVLGSSIHSSKGTLSFTTFENKDYSFDVNVIGSTDGSYYFKIDGLVNALDESDIMNVISSPGQTATDCNSTDSCSNTIDNEGLQEETILDTVNMGESSDITSSYSNMFIESAVSFLKEIDGVWVRITNDEVSSTVSGSIVNTGPLSCVTDLAGELKRNTNTISRFYSKYPFVTSTTENVNVAMKQYPVHAVGIDPENLVGFYNSLSSIDISDNARSCFGLKKNAEPVTENDLAWINDRLPNLFVEVDNDFNFSRLYTHIAPADSVVVYTMDLDFSYPENVNVSGPEEYKDFTSILKDYMKKANHIEE